MRSHAEWPVVKLLCWECLYVNNDGLILDRITRANTFPGTDINVIPLMNFNLYNAIPLYLLQSDPALCGSCPLVIPYYCRLGDLLCFVFIVRLLCFSVIDVLYVSLQYFDTIGWVLTCKNRLPYNLYCVGGDVKHCSINQSINGSFPFLQWNGLCLGAIPLG